MALLQNRGVRPAVVCTGTLKDARNPDYVEGLIQALSLKNIREQMFVLGTVPRPEVFSFMRQSICVLNPTRFEGHGLSLAEAHALGKRVLLSDLPVLREQQVPNAAYFNPEDPQDLADKMEAIWNSASAGPDVEAENTARAEWAIRQQAFGRAFLDLAREAMASGCGDTGSTRRVV